MGYLNTQEVAELVKLMREMFQMEYSANHYELRKYHLHKQSTNYVDIQIHKGKMQLIGRRTSTRVIPIPWDYVSERLGETALGK